VICANAGKIVDTINMIAHLLDCNIETLSVKVFEMKTPIRSAKHWAILATGHSEADQHLSKQINAT
jgi:hypothetical protein